MEVISGFEIVTICYKVGAQIIAVCNTWKDANEEVKARAITMESSWDKLTRQVDFMQRISSILDDALRHNLDNLLDQLVERLSAASGVIESVTRKESERRSRVIALSWKNKAAFVWKKEALDHIIRDLEDWQRRFDPSWFLIMTMASPVIERELQKSQGFRGIVDSTAKQERSAPSAARNPLALASGIRSVTMLSGAALKPVLLPESPLDTRVITYCDAKLGRLSGQSKWYIVDSISCESHSDMTGLKRDVRQLAARLSQADPLAFGLLNCKGVMPVAHEDSANPSTEPRISALNIVFRIPSGMGTLQSLRSLLLGQTSGVSLTQRVRIASELANSISYVHMLKFVHKNVRPESILCFNDSPNRRSHTFLVGFDAFRAADGKTQLHGDFAWERNLYRHPLRQGEYPAEKYRMQHDIYALGVCLLEIGLWKSFVEYSFHGKLLQPVAGSWYAEYEEWAGGSHQVPYHLVPWKVKDYLVELAKTTLPVRMGEKYAGVVVESLTCLDETEITEQNSGQGEGEKAMTVAVRYVEQVVSTLRDISV